jgi:hypothetical protein
LEPPPIVQIAKFELVANLSVVQEKAIGPVIGSPKVWAVCIAIVPLVWLLWLKKGVIAFFLLFVVAYAHFGRNAWEKKD